MRLIIPARVHATLACLFAFASLPHLASAGTLSITSPAPGSNSTGAVSIAASASETGAFHLELWDNGTKLGDVFSPAVNTAVSLPEGSHTTTVLAVSDKGQVLDRNSVTYSVSNAAAPGAVGISSPAAGSTSISAVRITAAANGSGPVHLQIWDNGYKLGDVSAGSVDGVYVLPIGGHVLTVVALADNGAVLGKSSVNYTVAENCVNSGSSQCDLDQQPADNTQGDCDPPEENMWVANPCGGGIQGWGGADPRSTGVSPVSEWGTLQDQGNLTLNGLSMHLSEVQGSDPSNVLFRGQSPSSAAPWSPDSHWTLDEYVYLPDPAAHQAFELDAQYSAAGLWTKFYTECAFNMNAGTGYWAVFDSETGGWIFLNGQTQNGQTPPRVPCNRSQFTQPWAGSGNPSFTGWHHIAWSFLRNGDGTVTYKSLTFDGATTQIDFRPNSANGGYVNNNGKFSALLQLDGVVNRDRQHDLVDAYVSEVNLSHTP